MDLLRSIIEIDNPTPVDARAEAYEKARQQLLANLNPKIKDRYLTDEAEWFSWFDRSLANLNIAHLRSKKPKETKLLLHVFDLILLNAENELMPEKCTYKPPKLSISDKDAKVLLSDGPEMPEIHIL